MDDRGREQQLESFLIGGEKMDKQKADQDRIRFGEVKFVGGKNVCKKCGNSGYLPYAKFCSCSYSKTARR